MHITQCSFVSALLWSGVWITTVYLLRRTRFQQRFGILPIALYLFCAARLLLPVEFPQTQIVEDSVIYAPIYYNLFLQKRNVLVGKPLSFVLIIVWLLGCCFFLFRYARQYRKVIRRIERYAAPWDGRTQTILEEIQRQTGRAVQIQGYTVAHIESAFSIGVLHKRIVLPEAGYTEADLRYILLHEYTHFLHYDTAAKLLIILFGAIFWWNPFVYLLQKDWEQVLEIRCDQSVTASLNAQERAAYLRAILSLMKQTDSRRRFSFVETTLFQSNAEADIRERFAAVITYSERRRCRIASAIFTGVCFTLLLASWFIQLQPKFDPPPPPPDDPFIYVDSSNAYILYDSSGAYWICVDNLEPEKISVAEVEFWTTPSFGDIEELEKRLATQSKCWRFQEPEPLKIIRERPLMQK